MGKYQYSMPYIQTKPTAPMPVYAPRKAPPIVVPASAYPAQAAPMMASTISMPAAGVAARAAQIKADFAKIKEQAAQERARLQAQAILRESDRAAALRGVGSTIPRARYSYGQQIAQASAAHAPAAKPTPAPVEPTRAAPGRYVVGYGQPSLKPAPDVVRPQSQRTAAVVPELDGTKEGWAKRMAAIAEARKPGAGRAVYNRYMGIQPKPIMAHGQIVPTEQDALAVRVSGPVFRPALTAAQKEVAIHQPGPYRRPPTVVPPEPSYAVPVQASSSGVRGGASEPKIAVPGANATSGSAYSPPKQRMVRGVPSMAGTVFTREGSGNFPAKYRMNRNGELRKMAWPMPLPLDMDLNTPGIELGSGINSGHILVGPDGSRYRVGSDGFIDRL